MFTKILDGRIASFNAVNQQDVKKSCLKQKKIMPWRKEVSRNLQQLCN